MEECGAAWYLLAVLTAGQGGAAAAMNTKSGWGGLAE
jgi:hypothetical protein